MLVLALACAAAAGDARAQDRELPDGVKAGPWILTPSLVTGYSRDSNVFYLSENSEGKKPDSVRTVNPTISATLPFRNSFLKLDYSATRVDYGRARVGRKLSQDFGLDLSLYFGSRDRLDLRAGRTLGLADTMRFDQGGSVVFDGTAYDLDTQEVELSREVYGRRGYDLRVTRSALQFDKSAEVALFDYTGYVGAFDYREPLSPRSWLVLAYEGRRFDHFVAEGTAEEAGLPPRESSDLYLVGLRGLLAERKAFQGRVGWASFRFPGGRGSDFRGLVGDGSVGFGIGPSLGVNLVVSRRPWPSFFRGSHYYLAESVTARIEKRWMRSTTVGIEASISRARFSDPVPDGDDAGLIRADRTLRWLTYANLMIRERLGFRVSIEGNRRYSNYEFGGYRKRVYFAGIVAGWR